MNNIKYIEININSITNSIDIAIDIKRNIYFTKDGKYPITNEKLEDLIAIIRTWKNEYGTTSSLDSEKFLICIKSEDGEETIKSNGELPDNYDLFKNWLGDLNV